MIQAGIIGGTGYVAGELLRCLVHHPKVQIDFVYSHSQPGRTIEQVHQDLFPYANMAFADAINPDVDVVFLCLGHNQAGSFLAEHPFPPQTKIIDLSHDFRHRATAQWHDRAFVYGLVEHNKAKIQEASAVANPGCFATALQLGLLPLADQGLLQDAVHIHAITGATGAGQTLTGTTHFSWRTNNISIYKAFTHQHLTEINETLGERQQAPLPKLNFLPIRGDFARGIFASLYMRCSLSESDVQDLYTTFYHDAPFTHINPDTIHLKQVVHTNYCLLQVQKIGDQVLITAILDNLLKGAAGQAIQNMNLLFGFEETTGLQFKAGYF